MQLAVYLRGGTYTCIIMEPASADGLLQSRIMLARNPLFSLGRDLGLL